MTPNKRFPAGHVTPHGAYHILHNRIPQFGITAYDGSVVFNMLGGLAIPDFVNAPGRVEVKEIKGLIPPWRIIKQKGATQDGETFVDALYDAIEIDLSVRIKGKDPADTRSVARYLYDSIDAKKTSRMWWFTHEMGYWWADIRWRANNDDPVGAMKNRTEDALLRLQADNGFWQSYPCVDEFVFTYATGSDQFDVSDSDDLGTHWDTTLGPDGTGTFRVVNKEANANFKNGRTGVARNKDFLATTNNQVSQIVIGRLKQWFFPDYASVGIWLRQNNTGTPGTSGVRLLITTHRLTLSYFVGGVEHVMRSRIMVIPPYYGEKFKLVAGVEGDERQFYVMRGSATVMSHKEKTADSPLGGGNRRAGISFSGQSTSEPPALMSWEVGDNRTVSQEGLVRRVNVGDQDWYDNYIVYGPGLFKFWDGPNAGPDEYVTFGPLEANQVMYLRTDPRKRGVVDMTSIPPTPQALKFWQKALIDFLDFATGNNSTPLAREIESWFGIKAPQGNPYSLLKGRWSRKSAIPAKSPGKAAEARFVRVAIDNGNANSKIIVTGTPLRRRPY